MKKKVIILFGIIIGLFITVLVVINIISIHRISKFSDGIVEESSSEDENYTINSGYFDGSEQSETYETEDSEEETYETRSHVVVDKSVNDREYRELDLILMHEYIPTYVYDKNIKRLESRYKDYNGWIGCHRYVYEDNDYMKFYILYGDNVDEVVYNRETDHLSVGVSNLSIEDLNNLFLEKDNMPITPRKEKEYYLDRLVMLVSEDVYEDIVNEIKGMLEDEEYSVVEIYDIVEDYDTYSKFYIIYDNKGVLEANYNRSEKTFSLEKVSYTKRDLDIQYKMDYEGSYHG